MSAVDRTLSNSSRVLWARLDLTLPPGIHPPKRPGDVGWDLEAMRDVRIGSGEVADVPVNARLHLPNHFYADVRNRSSMGRRGLYVDQNLIDTGYRGPLFVLVRNHNQKGIDIGAGERIAQLVFHKVDPVWLLEQPSIDTGSVRGEQGFGSTGR